MAKPLELSTADPAFSPTEPVLINGYLFLPPMSGKAPEHQLIDLCRHLREQHPEIEMITFRVNRDDGEWQSASFGRREEPEDEDGR